MTTKQKILKLIKEGKNPYQIGKILGHKFPYAYVYRVAREQKGK